MISGAEHWADVDYAVVDVEGNGARPPGLVEVAVVPVRHGRIGTASTWLVRPPTPITWHAHKIHGISDTNVAHAPTIDEVAPEVLTALGDAIPVGHGVHTNLAVLRRACPGGSRVSLWTP